MIKQIAAGFVLWRVENGVRLYLLLQHIAGHWSFAKGRTEPGESLEQTARRELQEETGITDATIVAPLPEPTVYTMKDYDGSVVEKTLYLFAAHTNESVVTLSHEHIGSGWFTFEEALAKATHEATRQAIIAAENL
jgi:8-oxo-dGTP pyrophosphatase MutT (NUDIX family)